MANASSPPPDSRPNWLRNLAITMAAVTLAVAVLVGIRTQAVTPSLGELATSAIPYETALASGKPTLVEFYANWCTSCQAMVGDMVSLRDRYSERVNFVMLNVDNNKWLPEMLAYRVDGIPHFVYLDDEGQLQGEAIGEQPRLVIAENLDALISRQTLPHTQDTGTISELEGNPLSRQTVINDDPRSHGSVPQS